MRRVVAALLALAVTASSRLAFADDTPSVGELVGFIRWSGLLLSLGVLVGVSVLLRFLSRAVDSLSQRFAHRRLLFQQIETFTRFAVYIMAGGVVIGLSFRVNQAVLALVGGTLAVAIGFAMRDLVAAMIAGITIMLDRPFQVGDRINFGGEYGDVTSIGLRSVRIQTLDDNTVTVPNNKVLTDVTSCGNYGALDMQVGIDFYIAVDQDVEVAERIVQEAILTSEYAYLHKPIETVVRQVIKGEYLAVHVRGKGYVLDTRYEKAFESDVTRRTLRAFRERGIAPPLPRVPPHSEPGFEVMGQVE